MKHLLGYPMLYHNLSIYCCIVVCSPDEHTLNNDISAGDDGSDFVTRLTLVNAVVGLDHALDGEVSLRLLHATPHV